MPNFYADEVKDRYI